MSDLPMSTEDMTQVFCIIKDWAALKAGSPVELMAKLRDAGFPIVAWSSVTELILPGEGAIVTIPRTVLESAVDAFDAGLPDPAENEELADIIRVYLYPHEFVPKDTDGHDHTDLQPPLHLLQGEPHT